MKWYLKCLRQYADFSGRARRKEYWMFYLFNIIFIVGLAIIGAIIGALLSGGDEDTVFAVAYLLYILYGFGVLVPNLAVTVRRLHDIGKSGWWILISLVPFIGGIWLIVLLATDSMPDTNEYGPNPKQIYDDSFDANNNINNNLNNKEMANSTQPDNYFQNSGTVPSESFAGGFGTSKKKTMIEGQEETSTKENPKNLNVLCGMLVSFSKTEIGEYWDLREGNNSIGASSSENTIVLSEKHVSGKHANINVSKDIQNNCWKLQLVDLSSTNGTELNGNRLPIYSGVEIKNGDKIKIGEYILLLIVADKFVNKLSKNEKFQKVTQDIGYDERDFFSSNPSDSGGTNPMTSY